MMSRYHNDAMKFAELKLSKQIAIRVIKNLTGRKGILDMDNLPTDIADEIYEEMVDSIGDEVYYQLFKKGI